MAAPKPFPLSKPELRAIYQRLGEEKLGTILRDFYLRMSKDTMLGFFFDGRDLDAIAARQQAFLMRAMGATDTYSGKPPAQAHGALPPILNGHFDRRLRLLEETLRDHGLTSAEIAAWVGFESAFREGIVK